MFDKLRQIESRYEELGRQLALSAHQGARAEYAKLAKARAELEEIVTTFREYKDVLGRIQEAQHILSEDGDAELHELAEAELVELREREVGLEQRLRELLLPKDPADEKSVFCEIRAGAGGDEAALFAADLARMYTKYAERKGWRVEVIDRHPTGQGGFKEIIFAIHGRGAWSRLKFERGVHRVQRIPVTESAGRIHTSTVTVAILPEAEEVEIRIDEKDLKIDVYRASGPGGQGVNTTDSAVRI
ncbi:MAG: PCRF domain-containing protein, partial [Candidatus Rokubacteria bacterium]|nr:PCRF domain-containing protein [Candidatus Rokubacteria bacterium]